MRGVTLTELIMVIVIISIVGGVLSLGIKETIDLWDFLTFCNEIASQGRMALMWMGREMRQMALRDPVFEPIEVAESSRLRFTVLDLDGDNNDDIVEFYRNNDDELRRIFNDNPAEGNVLANRVSNLIFTYYDANNSQLTTPVVDRTQIYRIAIALTVSNDSGSRALDLSSQIHPRNLY